MTHPPDEHTPGTGAGRPCTQEFVDQPRVARQLAASGSSDNTAGMRCAASGDAGRRNQCQSFGSQSTCAQDNARAPLRNRRLCHTVIASALAYASRAPTVARANIPFLRRALAHPVVDGGIGRREGREAVDVPVVQTERGSDQDRVVNSRSVAPSAHLAWQNSQSVFWC